MVYKEYVRVRVYEEYLRVYKQHLGVLSKTIVCLLQDGCKYIPMAYWMTLGPLIMYPWVYRKQTLRAQTPDCQDFGHVWPCFTCWGDGPKSSKCLADPSEPGGH